MIWFTFLRPVAQHPEESAGTEGNIPAARWVPNTSHTLTNKTKKPLKECWTFRRTVWVVVAHLSKTHGCISAKLCRPEIEWKHQSTEKKDLQPGHFPTFPYMSSPVCPNRFRNFFFHWLICEKQQQKNNCWIHFETFKSLHSMSHLYTNNRVVHGVLL